MQAIQQQPDVQAQEELEEAEELEAEAHKLEMGGVAPSTGLSRLAGERGCRQ